MKFLLFQLYAPFSSWGSPLPGAIRRSDDHPTKSGIMGFLAAALGITRDREPEYVQLAASTGFACREDRSGDEMRDFHTVRVGVQPIISDRYYLTNAVFTVCLWEKGEHHLGLEKIADALDKPKFAPFLGRKCCLLGLPPAPSIVEAEDLKEAFNLYEPSKLLRLDTESLRKVYWEGDDRSIDIVEDLKRSDQSIGFFKYSSRIEFAGVMEVNHVLQ